MRLTFVKKVFPLYDIIKILGKEGIDMAQNRVRIVDVADALGLSTATVSKVIHGKTEKISDETVKRVQQELESSGYIPNMAGILLARNNSRIIGVVVNEKGYFLMIKTTSDISEIPVFASMWNMDGLILMGFCEADYEKLRNQMRISFVVYDGYFEKCSKVVNLVINHYDGGYQAGDAAFRAKTAIECLEAMRDGLDCESEIVLPVKLIKRESTGLL